MQQSNSNSVANYTTTVSLFGLVMLITGAFDGISNLPSLAIFGQQLIFFFVLGSVLLLMPLGLVSAELCRQFPSQSGVYAWAKEAYGGGFAALTIWLQWITSMVWFPTCLTTLVGTIAFMIDPNLTHHPLFLVVTSLSAFWAMTLINLKGIGQSSKAASLATSFGMIVPMILIIVLSLLWVILGKPIAIHFKPSMIIPNLHLESSWTSLTAALTAFSGIELIAVHAKNVKNANRIFPKAFVLAMILIFFTLGLGALGIALVIPHHDILLVAGTIQAFHRLFIGFHVPWLSKVLGVMLVFGSLGTMVNWLISPANGLAQAAKDYHFAESLTAENNNGVPSKVLIVQGVVVSIMSMAFFIMPSVNGSYWLLLDLSTELYAIMYLLMFISAIKLSFTIKKTSVIPGKKSMMVLNIFGVLGCVIALTVGFFPPPGIDVGSYWHFFLKFSAGVLIMTSPALLCYRVKNKKVAGSLQLEG